MKLSSLFFAALVMVYVIPSHASTITLTFTGLRDEEPIDNFYNGGTGGYGSTGGTNYGISFTSDSLAVISKDAGGGGNISMLPAPATTTAAFFLSGAGDTMNVAAGFQNGFSFYYTSPFYVGAVDVYSGLNGTGTLLAVDSLTKTAGYCDPAFAYSCWVNSGVSFSGTAESAVFSGVANQVAFADITTGAPLVPTVTPEPSTLILVGSGVLGLAGAARRRFKA